MREREKERKKERERERKREIITTLMKKDPHTCSALPWGMEYRSIRGHYVTKFRS